MFTKPHFTEISSTSNIKVALGGIVNMVKEKNQKFYSKCLLLTNKYKGSDTL